MWKRVGCLVCISIGVVACQSDAPKKQDSSQTTAVSPTPPEEVEAPAAQPAGAKPPAAPAHEKFPEPDAGSHTRDLDALVRGKAWSEIQARYGAPTDIYVFALADGVPEFRVELLNDFKPDSPQFQTKRITEHIYHYVDDGYHAVVWYHEVDGEQTALQAMSWGDGVEF